MPEEGLITDPLTVDPAIHSAVVERIAQMHARTTMFDVAEAAQRLSIGRSRIFESISTGELASVRIGQRRLVSLADLEAFVTACRAAA